MLHLGARSVQPARAASGSLALTDDEKNKILKHAGGKDALEALFATYEYLAGEGFSRDQLLEVACGHHGSPALTFMEESLELLRAVPLSDKEIARIAAKGGCAALEEQLVLYDALRKKGEGDESKIDHQHILETAAKAGGSKSLRALDSHYDALLKREFTHDQIMKIAKSRSSAKKLKNLANAAYLQRMQDQEFSHDQITAIAVKSPVSVLDKVSEQCEAFIKLDFTPAQIVDIAQQRGASAAIEILLTKTKELQDKRLTIEQIALLASQEDAKSALKAILEFPWRGSLQPQQLCDLLANHRYPEERLKKFMAWRDEGLLTPSIVKLMENKRRPSPSGAVAGPSAKRRRTDKTSKA